MLTFRPTPVDESPEQPPRVQSPAPSADDPRPALWLCGCGPGELVAWARPLLQALAASGRGWRVTVVLWPRLFLSGREGGLARALPGVERVVTPSRALALPATAPQARPGTALVLHLGGPARLSLALGRRLRVPVLAYCDRPEALPPGFTTTYAAAPDGLPGNLLVDSVQPLREARRDHQAEIPTLGFLPGSRPFQLRLYLPHVAPVARALSERLGQVRFLIARSPLVGEAMLERGLGTAPGARFERAAQGLDLVAGPGLRIPVVTRERVLREAQVLVCSPGTNTGEAAALAIPHLVVAPFDPSLPLFDGLAGLLERHTPFGRHLKARVMRRLAGGVPYFAQANARAGRMLVPELQGPLDLERVTGTLAGLLADAPGRRRMSRELEGTMGPPGAAERLALLLERHLVSRHHH